MGLKQWSYNGLWLASHLPQVWSILCAEVCHVCHLLWEIFIGATVAFCTLFRIQFVGRFLCKLVFRAEVRVVTPHGTCLGYRLAELANLQKPKNAVVKFCGIPYASFQGRFEAPAPLPEAPKTTVVNPRRWSLAFIEGTAATTSPQTVRFGLDSPVPLTALKMVLLKLFRGYMGSERECLQLNVWRPYVMPAAPEQLLPVMVFVHGGAFVFGSAHQRLTDAGRWARRGCVTVTINYRLGVLGFARIPGKASNIGLRDQLEALRWVKRNIVHFGGDPENITVAGQSAGAMSLGMLLGVEALYKEHLAQKIIMMSGTGHHIQTAAESADTVTTMSSCMKQAVTVADLQAMPLHKLLGMQDKVLRVEVAKARRLKSTKLLPFSPWVEKGDDLLPQHPMALIRRRKQEGLPLIPVLIGSTDCEFTLFSLTWWDRGASIAKLPMRLDFWASLVQGEVDVDALAQNGSMAGSPQNGSAPPSANNTPIHGATDVQPLGRKLSASVLEAYKDGSYQKRIQTPTALWDAIHTDWVFRLPTEHLANVYAEPGKDGPHGTPIFVYRFEKSCAVPALGAIHIHDLHYSFGNWNAAPYLCGGYNLEDAKLSHMVMTDLYRFLAAKDLTRLTEDASTPCRKRGKNDARSDYRWYRWDPVSRPVKVYGYDNKPCICTVRNGDEKEIRSWGDAMERMTESFDFRVR